MKPVAASTTPPATFVRQLGGAWLERLSRHGYVPAIRVGVIFAIADWGRLPQDVRAAWLVPEDVC